MQDPASASVYWVGGAGLVEFLFWLPRLPPRAIGLTTTGDGDDDDDGERASLISALVQCSTVSVLPLVRENRMEGPPLAGQGGLVHVGSSIPPECHRQSASSPHATSVTLS